MSDDHKSSDKGDGCLQYNMRSGPLETSEQTTILNTFADRKKHGIGSSLPDINSQIDTTDDRAVLQTDDGTNSFLNIAETTEYLPLSSKDDDKTDERSLGNIAMDNGTESGAEVNELASDAICTKRISTSKLVSTRVWLIVKIE